MTLDGVLSEIPLPSGSTPSVVITGPDGRLWVADQALQAVHRVATDGTVVSYALGFPPNGVAVGGDAAIWATSAGDGTVARMVPDDPTPQFFTIPDPLLDTRGVTLGSDGAVWFLVHRTNAVWDLGRMMPDGTYTGFTVPGFGQSAIPSAVFGSTAGDIWFNDINGQRLGRFSIATSTFAPNVGAGNPPGAMTNASDGTIW